MCCDLSNVSCSDLTRVGQLVQTQAASVLSPDCQALLPAPHNNIHSIASTRAYTFHTTLLWSIQHYWQLFCLLTKAAELSSHNFQLLWFILPRITLLRQLDCPTFITTSMSVHVSYDTFVSRTAACPLADPSFSVSILSCLQFYNWIITAGREPDNQKKSFGNYFSDLIDLLRISNHSWSSSWRDSRGHATMVTP